MFTFQLVTLEKLEFKEEIYEAILPTSSGQIAVLPGHIPLVTLLEPGVVSLRRNRTDGDGTLEHVAVSGGFAQISGQSIRILADSATRA
ncbi:ATP synthase F1 subunit epsilon, partial [Candidatus Berkelbacteria bacterium CG06_land_8_20_14_3_00_43_10]